MARLHITHYHYSFLQSPLGKTPLDTSNVCVCVCSYSLSVIAWLSTSMSSDIFISRCLSVLILLAKMNESFQRCFCAWNEFILGRVPCSKTILKKKEADIAICTDKRQSLVYTQTCHLKSSWRVSEDILLNIQRQETAQRDHRTRNREVCRITQMDEQLNTVENIHFTASWFPP